MKKIFVFVLTLVSVSMFAAQKTDGPLKLLAIGNSFSVDAVNQNLWELANADGQEIIIGNAEIGGCSLKKHLNNAQNNKPAYKYFKRTVEGQMNLTENCTLEQALADEKWDVITLQQQSSEAGQMKSFEPTLTELIEYVKSHSKADVKIVWHMTWAYTNGSCNAGFMKFNENQKAMYDSLVFAAKAVSKRHNMEVIPAGTAIQNIRKSIVGDSVTRDGYHMNYVIGRYAVACTWYEYLFGRSVVGNPYSTKYIQPWQREVVQEAAHKAVLNPFEISKCGPDRTPANYDESKVPAYTLPNPLVMEDGTPVSGKRQWYDERRPELLKMFTREMYGYAPAAPEGAHFEVRESSDKAFDGKAVRKQVRYFLTASDKFYLDLLIYLPKNAAGPVPVFMGINFQGNWGAVTDTNVFMPSRPELQKRYGVFENKNQRGRTAHHWPVEMLLDAGYGLVTYCRADVDPDFYDGFVNGITRLIYKKGQDYPEPDQWGNIAEWAWSLSRVMDYIERDSAIDAHRVAIVGHSRLGKAALWAGANDARFKIVISNDSGCCGSAISRRCYGERITDINQRFPHWFCANFQKYNDRESELPFDQHELLALIAPRPLYVASATQDRWADPDGELLGAQEAAKVYEFLGLPKDYIAYHRREGKHNMLAFDWERYIAFADRFFKK